MINTDNPLEEILKDAMDAIATKGYVCTARLPFPIDLELKKLQVAGTLTTLTELGINFINGEYFYLLAGNPMQVKVIELARGLFGLQKSI